MSIFYIWNWKETRYENMKQIVKFMHSVTTQIEALACKTTFAINLWSYIKNFHISNFAIWRADQGSVWRTDWLKTQVLTRTFRHCLKTDIFCRFHSFLLNITPNSNLNQFKIQPYQLMLTTNKRHHKWIIF